MNIKFFLLVCLGLFNGIMLAQSNNPSLQYDIKASIDNGNILSGVVDIEVNDYPSTIGDTIWLQLDINSYNSNNSTLVNDRLKMGSASLYFKKVEEQGGYMDISCKVDGIDYELKYLANKMDLAYLIVKNKGSFKVNLDYLIKLPEDYINEDTSSIYLACWYPRLAYIEGNTYLPISFTNVHDMPLNYYELEAQISIADTLSSITPSLYHEISKGKSKYKYHYSGSSNFEVYFSKATIYLIDSISIGGKPFQYIKHKHGIKNILNNDRLQELLDYLSNNYLSYPHDYLILDIDFSCNCMYLGMAYSRLGKDRYYKSFYGDKVVNHIVNESLKDRLKITNLSDIWIREGLRTYMLGNFYFEKVQEYPNRKYKSFSYFDNELVSSRKQIQNMGPILTDEVELLDKYEKESAVVGANVFKAIEQEIGLDEITRIINEKIFKIDKILTTDRIQQIFEEETSSDFQWLFEGILKNNGYPDFKLKEINEDSGVATIINESKVKASTLLRVQYLDGDYEDIKLESFVGSQQVTISNFNRVAYLHVDPHNLTMSNFRKAKVYKAFGDGPKMKKSASVKLNIGLNNADGFLVGLNFGNNRINKSNIDYKVATFYGLKSKEMVGEGYLFKNYYTKLDVVKSFNIGIKGKSYHYFTPKVKGEQLDPLRYYRFNPQLNIDFRHPVYGGKNSKMTFDFIRLYEAKSLFSIEGDYFGSEYESSDIYRLSYKQSNFNALVKTAINAQLEYQAYDVDKSYLKLTSSISKDYKYNAQNSISFRLWGGYFIQNSQRNSSNYVDRFTRGSLALAHQGFNDYSYDEYFHTRQDQSSRLIQQTSMAGGGFKTGVGNLQRVLMSNDYAMALNIVSDIPIKIFNELEIKLFGDIGFYRSKSFENDVLQGNYVYSTGLSMYIDEGFQIHLPIFNSKIISDRYTDLDRSLFKRISFTVDINEFSFTQTATSKVK